MILGHFNYIANSIYNETFKQKSKMKKYTEIKDLVMSLESDFEKFYEKKNLAAGTRVRKGMQELKNLAQETRLEVQETKNKGE